MPRSETVRRPTRKDDDVVSCTEVAGPNLLVLERDEGKFERLEEPPRPAFVDVLHPGLIKGRTCPAHLDAVWGQPPVDAFHAESQLARDAGYDWLHTFGVRHDERPRHEMGFDRVSGVEGPGRSGAGCHQAVDR